MSAFYYIVKKTLVVKCKYFKFLKFVLIFWNSEMKWLINKNTNIFFHNRKSLDGNQCSNKKNLDRKYLKWQNNYFGSRLCIEMKNSATNRNIHTYSYAMMLKAWLACPILIVIVVFDVFVARALANGWHGLQVSVVNETLVQVALTV